MSMRVQGFKSLRDVELRDLADVNVFHGANDVGKSNILQALDVFFQVLPVAVRSIADEETNIFLKDSFLLPYTKTIFRQGGDKRIVWEAQLKLPRVENLPLRLTMTDEREGVRLQLAWPDGEPDEEVKRLLDDPANDFTLVAADRRLSREWMSDEIVPIDYRPLERHGSPVESVRLRQVLFDCVNSPDMRQRERFKRLVQLLNTHFTHLDGEPIGELDIALDMPREVTRERPGDPLRHVRDVLVRFLRPDLPEPILIEDAGSGVQQVVLMLGQMLFNPGRLVGIEEPEMNLNARWQDKLRALIRGLVTPDGMDQIFISSHSARFEFRENFYRVDYVHGETTMEPRGREALPEATGEAIPSPSENKLQRLNSENQVTLYEEVISDLGLKYGDMVVFVKNEAGQWELQRGDQMLQDLKEVLSNGGST